jgi:hypothetical protein
MLDKEEGELSSDGECAEVVGARPSPGSSGGNAPLSQGVPAASRQARGAPEQSASGVAIDNKVTNSLMSINR